MKNVALRREDRRHGPPRGRQLVLVHRRDERERDPLGHRQGPAQRRAVYADGRLVQETAAGSSRNRCAVVNQVHAARTRRSRPRGGRCRRSGRGSRAGCGRRSRGGDRRGRTASPPGRARPAAAASASARSISGSTSSRLSSGGRPSSSPPPPSSQCAAAIRAASSAVSTRAETGRPAARGVEERQRVGAPAEHRARRASRAARRSRARRAATSRPTRRRAICVSRERLQVGGDVGRGRPAAVDAAEPAGRHEPDPGRLADGERAADRRRSDGALHDGAPRGRAGRACAPTRRTARAPPR